MGNCCSSQKSKKYFKERPSKSFPKETAQKPSVSTARRWQTAKEITSTANNSMNRVVTPQVTFVQKVNGKSVLVDSYESLSREYIMEVRHPNDFFRDLSGPFFVFKV